MQHLMKIFFSPAAFGVGFLWPLVTQVMVASGVMATGWQTWVMSALIVLPFALMAQFRGSWIWIK